MKLYELMEQLQEIAKNQPQLLEAKVETHININSGSAIRNIVDVKPVTVGPSKVILEAN